MFHLTDLQEEKAIKLHRESIVVDGHCDTILDIAQGKRSLGDFSSTGHLDLPRLKEGSVNVQFFALFIESQFKPDRAMARGLNLLSLLLKEEEKNCKTFKIAKNYKEIIDGINDGKNIGIISVEGGEILQGNLEILYLLKRLGVSSICLTWNERNEIADGVGENHGRGGLTDFGVEVVKEMNRLGMIIDVSHISPRGFWDVIEITKQPIIASHSNAFKLCPHRRNLDDDQIKAIARNNGVIGINFATDFLHRNQTVKEVLEHIVYISELIGTDYVGLGSDFDGIPKTPKGLEDVTKMINITKGLVYHGFSDIEIKKILGGNFIRVIKTVLR